MIEQDTDLSLTIPPVVDALAVFASDKMNGEHTIEPILAHIRAQIDQFTPDLTTITGRKRSASMARKVAEAKIALEEVGKGLADKQKAIPKLIDATRKHIKDTLDAWRDEVRKPLTEWEAAETDRIGRHTDAIAAIRGMEPTPVATSATIHQLLRTVSAVVIDGTCEEFSAEYAIAKDAAMAALTSALPIAEKREAEAVELARLRSEAEAREARDRDERLRIEGAERAKQEAVKAAQAIELATAKRDADLKAQIAAAERAAAAAADKARLDAEVKALGEAKEKARREADVEHRRQINTDAAAAFVSLGVDLDTAKTVIRLIASGSIPSVTINY